MSLGTLYVGLDADKEYIVACVLRSTQAPPLEEVSLPNDEKRLRKFLRPYARQAILRVGYEAGFSGYGLVLTLRAWGYEGRVIAPLGGITSPPGRSIKLIQRADTM